MEEIHKHRTTPSFNSVPSFNSSDARNEEIKIAMWSVEESIRMLYEASKKGSIQTLNTLIEEDPNLIQTILTSAFNTESPLHVSISHGHLEFTRLLLDHRPELAAEVNAFQRTPLHLASANGDMGTVRALLETNTSACLVYDKSGLIPLHYAVSRGKIEIVQELIHARRQSVWMKLDNGQTVLHLCVQGNHLEAMKLLIETFMNRDEDFLNTIDDEGNTVLDLSIMLRQSEMVGYLLSIPQVRTRTSTTNFAATKESPNSQKTKTIRTTLKIQRRESGSSSTKKKTRRRRWKVWRKNLMYKGDWIQDVQGTMMLVATVIATVAFEAGINPPGGVWQQDTHFNFKNNYVNLSDQDPITHLYKDLHNVTIFPAGTAIMAYQQRRSYLVYLIANMVSFLASVSVILLIISRVPLKNRVGSWVLVLAMCAAVFFLALGYLQGVVMVNLLYVTHDIPTYKVYLTATMFWLGVVGLVGLFHVIRFNVWMVKSLWCTFTSTLKSSSFQYCSSNT